MDKKIGYLLLLCGVGILIGSSLLLWKIFYGEVQPPQAFVADSTISLTMPSGMVMNVPLPPHVNRLANLFLSFMLSFFLATVGAKIGGLGVGLINKQGAEEKPRSPSSV